MKEWELARFWERVGPGREWPVGGQGWKVAFSGRPRPNGGPDFQGALLRCQGEEVRGDVEVHVRASQWLSHGHHRDPRFNGVVLHVVFWEDLVPIHRQDGEEVVGLSLHQHFLPQEVAGWQPRPCGEVEISELEGWGEERFREKAQGLAERLGRAEPDQVLYEGIMRALGYSRNQEPMAQLAQSLPFAELVKLGRGRPPDQRQFLLHRLFLERAERLPWQGLGVRPANNPLKRLKAMTQLVLRYEGGLVAGLASKIRQGIGVVEAGLVVPGLLGRERAREIAVNILLPFFLTLGEGRALELFRAYPPLRENEITRWLGRRLVLRDKVNSARGQQGLIHLYKVFCEQGRCCPLRAV